MDQAKEDYLRSELTAVGKCIDLLSQLSFNLTNVGSEKSFSTQVRYVGQVTQGILQRQRKMVAIMAGRHSELYLDFRQDLKKNETLVWYLRRIGMSRNDALEVLDYLISRLRHHNSAIGYYIQSGH